MPSPQLMKDVRGSLEVEDGASPFQWRAAGHGLQP